MHAVWLMAISKLHVSVQHVLLQQDVFVAVMEERISMSVNWENDLVQRKLALEFFIKANAVRSLNVKFIIIFCNLSSFQVLVNYFSFLMYLDPCEDMTCSFNARCVVDSNFKASCQCPKCPPTTRRVCGSDGRTYVNECELRKRSCTTKSNIRVLHQGKCSKFIQYQVTQQIGNR